MSNSYINRPFKWGANDRREFIVQDSEVALRCENNASGSPIYVGRAKVGILDADTKWQICFIAYDINDGVTSVTWPENSSGIASSSYEFVWDDRVGYTFS
jgi:hypothetical protein